jgi:Ca2+/Na+ antiporter
MSPELMTFMISAFIMAASCYLLFISSEKLEGVGKRLSRLLHVPEDVGASTLGAFSTSGPEIVMAILAATAFIGSGWAVLEMGEKASSGTLNMLFSAMDNLIGIGCVGIIFMICKGTIDKNETIELSPATYLGLSMYVLASSIIFYFLYDGVFTPREGKIMMVVGVAYILLQFAMPSIRNILNIHEHNEDDDDEEEEEPMPTTFLSYIGELFTNGFAYAFLVFLLVVLVRECLGSTFSIAALGIASVGGILLAFTSYVSSFPEFMLSYRYAIANKKSALLGMLFGSNVIDLAFSGFRSVWLSEDVPVYTTGQMPELLMLYIGMLPLVAVISLIAISMGKVKYNVAYPMMVFYVLYIGSGLVLL